MLQCFWRMKMDNIQLQRHANNIRKNIVDISTFEDDKYENMAEVL